MWGKTEITTLQTCKSHIHCPWECKPLCVNTDLIIIIIIDNFCIALFCGVHKLTALYNIFQHFLRKKLMKVTCSNNAFICLCISIRIYVYAYVPYEKQQYTKNKIILLYYYLPMIPSPPVPTPTPSTHTHTHTQHTRTHTHIWEAGINIWSLDKSSKCNCTS